MRIRNATGQLLVSLVLLGITACHSTSDPKTNPEFARADTDRDGKVSFEEFARYVNKAMFKRLDANGNGTLSLSEWKASDTSPDFQKHFEALDADKNGSVDLSEYLKAAGNHSNLRETFKDLDRNNDGFLSHEEFSAFDGLKVWAVHF